MYLSMHKRVQYNLVKRGIEVALYTALEGTSKISSKKLRKKLMVHLSVQLRVHLRVH